MVIPLLYLNVPPQATHLKDSLCRFDCLFINAAMLLIQNLKNIRWIQIVISCIVNNSVPVLFHRQNLVYFPIRKFQRRCLADIFCFQSYIHSFTLNLTFPTLSSWNQWASALISSPSTFKIPTKYQSLLRAATYPQNHQTPQSSLRSPLVLKASLPYPLQRPLGP